MRRKSKAAGVIEKKPAAELVSSMLEQIKSADVRLMATFDEIAVLDQAMRIRLKTLLDQVDDIKKWRKAINWQLSLLERRIRNEQAGDH